MSGDDHHPPVLSRLRMPEAVCDALACPHCGRGVAPSGNVLACPAGHTFDVAREGYVSLLGGRGAAGAGDTAGMVRARLRFQQAGHYAQLATRLARLAAEREPGLVVDVGAGTGTYLRAVLEHCPHAVGLALDASKLALRHAARVHPRAGAATCDARQGLPLRSDSVSLLLNVFAPRDGAEFRRVLTGGGALVVVTPTVGHLAELVEALDLLTVDARKEERLESALAGHLAREHREELCHPLTLSRADVASAVAMGPSAHHVDPAELERRAGALPDPATVTASFAISVYRPCR